MCAWGRAGKSTSAPRLDGYAHSYQLVVQDAAGKIAITDYLPILAIDKASTPYKGKAQVIPGKVNCGLFDEGGKNVAFYRPDKKEYSRKNPHLLYDGTWLRYTVDVKSAGKYIVTMNRNKVRDITRGTNFYPDMQALIFVNNRKAGTFTFKKGETATVIKDMDLPAGEVKLTIMPVGGNELTPASMDFVQQ